VLIDIDGGHKVQAEQGQISQVVPGQFFTAQMCMQAAEATKAIARYAYALKVGQLNLPGVANDYIFDVAFAVDQRPNLSSRFKRKLAKVPGELRSDNIPGRNPALIEFFKTPHLIRLQAMSVTVKVLHLDKSRN
jgi:hypothetical protein